MTDAEPRTAAGRALLAQFAPDKPYTHDTGRRAIRAIEQEARAAAIAERDAELLTHGQINVGTLVGYEAGLAEGRREQAAEVARLLDELAESPLPGARYAYDVVRRRLDEGRREQPTLNPMVQVGREQ